MCLPYGIEEQYLFLESFLNDPSSKLLRIEEPYYETPAILTIVLQAFETKYGPSNIHIRYVESDSAIKRFIINKKTNQMKTIILDMPYTIGWELTQYYKNRLVVAIRSGIIT
jgi:hypothetical protein